MDQLFTLLILGLSLNYPRVDAKESINIALLREYNQTQPYNEVIAFAIKYINKNKDILPNHKLAVSTEFYNSNPSTVVQSVCNVTKNGVSGIITAGGSTIVAMQADTLVPYRIPLYSLAATDPFLASTQRNFLIRALPSDAYQSTVVFELLKYHDWKVFSVLTSSNTYGINGMLELQRLIIVEMMSIETIQHFQIPGNPRSLNVTDELNIIKNSLTRIIVLHCDGRYVRSVLEQAHNMDMVKEGYVWIVTDGVTSNPSELEFTNGYLPPYYNGLIGTRPLYSYGSFYEVFRKNFSEEHPDLSKNSADVYALLAFDGLLVLSDMLHNYIEDGNTLKEQSIECVTDFSNLALGDLQWQNGTGVMEYLNKVDIQGIVNKLNFAEDNGPLYAQYDVVNFREGRFLKVGKWNKTVGLQMKTDVTFFGGSTTVPLQKSITLNGFHFKFGVLEDEPFIIESEVNCTGNACFTGFCMDLVNKLAEDLNFTYTFVKPADGKFGGLTVNGGWNGLIKSLLDGDIDMITVDLSVNLARSTVIDFTFAFKEASIIAVVKYDEVSSNRVFFLSPFTADVWYSILIANVLCTLFLTFVNKVSPYGFYGGKMHALLACKCSNCVANRKLTAGGFKNLGRESEFECLTEELECENENSLDRISLYNSFWMISTGLFGQSAENNPYCAPGRFVIMGWWFFMMIMIAMYTANLAAALTVKNINVGFTEISELLEQDDLTWGTVRSTNPEDLLKNSIRQDYNELIAKGDHVDSVTEGLIRVRNGGYVLIHEKPVLTYLIGDDCDLKSVSVGSDIQSFQYAFGIAKLSPYASIFNHKILEYKELGYFDALWTKWGGSQSCSQTSDTVTLGLGSLGGIFMVLGAVLIISITLVFAELFYASYLDAYGNKHRVGDEGKSGSPSAYQARSGYLHSLYIRLKLIGKDFTSHWFSVESLKQLNVLKVTSTTDSLENEVVNTEFSVRNKLNVFLKSSNGPLLFIQNQKSRQSQT